MASCRLSGKKIKNKNLSTTYLKFIFSLNSIFARNGKFAPNHENVFINLFIFGEKGLFPHSENENGKKIFSYDEPVAINLY